VAAVLLLLAVTGLHLRGRNLPAGVPVNVVFTTANIAGGLSREKAMRAYRIALQGSDVLCTQEMQGRDARHFVPDGWATAQWGRRGARARVAIHWQARRFRRMKGGNVLLHASRMFKSATRYIEWVRLQDQWTGRCWTVVGVHLVPHADDPRTGGITRLPRRALVNTSIRVLIGLVRATTIGGVVVLGDFNVDAGLELRHRDRTDLTERFRAVGMVNSMQQLGVVDTHHRASYDQMFFRLVRGQMRLVGHWVHQDGPGDHLAYSVRVQVRTRKGYGPP